MEVYAEARLWKLMETHGRKYWQLMVIYQKS